jgi:signal transduction histidine kinase
MNNVARHSGATACTITINVRGSELQLLIEDNGCGLKADCGHGLGLIAMRERSQAQGGALVIESPPWGGTRLAVTMQVAASDRMSETQGG